MLATVMRCQGERQPAHRPVQHRGVDPAPLRPPAGRHQRAEDGDGGLEAAAPDIRHLDRQGYGWAIPGAVEPEGAGGSQVIEVVAGARGEGTVLPVTGDRAHDQPRIARVEGIPAKTEPGHDARAVAFDEHIGVLDQAEEEVAAQGRLEVQGEAALVAVDGVEQDALAVDKRWGPAQVVATAGLLDLDHVRAHVGQEHGAEGAGQEAGQVEYSDAGQGHVENMRENPDALPSSLFRYADRLDFRMDSPLDIR